MIYLVKIFCLIFYFNVFISRINGKNVNNKNDFINDIKNGEEILSIENNIILDDHLVFNITSKKFSITGSSNNSKLSFPNSNIISLFFLEDCEEINFSNISINGNLKFTNNKNIVFNNVKLNGYLISNNDDPFNKNLTIQIKDSELHLLDHHNGYEIYNYNLDVLNSEVYGNNISNLHLMKIENEKNYLTNINIDNSYFNGNYNNGAISIKYANVTCNNSTFERFYSGNELNR